MAVPDFQSLMLPLPQLAADGRERSLAETRTELATRLHLSDADVSERLPSGQSRLANRVAWARYYLTEAGLFVATKRAHFIITDRGRSVLAEKPKRLDAKYLERFEEFNEFKTRRRTPDATTEEVVGDSTTPEEMLEQAHGKLRASLAADILARVRSATPQFLNASSSSCCSVWATVARGVKRARRSGAPETKE